MTAQQLKNSILQLAVQGKLVPQDPNDEPASVLLERIRKEKEKLIKEGKIKREKNPSVIFRGADNTPYEKVGNAEPVSIADEIPFDIPDTWEWVRFGSVIELQSGQDLTPDMYNSNGRGIPYITGASNIDDGTVIINRWTELGKSFAYKGDILLTCKGTVGTMAILAEEKAHIARQIMAIRPLPELFIPYIQIVLHTLVESLKSAAKSMIPGIAREDVLLSLLPLPPKVEQIRIVDKILELSPLLSMYANAYDALESIDTAFPESLRKSILQMAVQGKLVPQDENDEPASVLLERIRADKEKLIAAGKIKRDKNESVIFRRDNSHYEKLGDIERCIDDEIPFEIPNNWAWARLKNIVNPVSARRVHQSDWKSVGIPFYRAREIAKLSESGSVNNELFISRELYEEYAKGGIPQAGDIMVTAVGTLGKAYIVKENDVFYYKDASVICLENFSKTDPAYLGFLLQTPYFENQIKQNSAGTTVGTITLISAREYLVPLPPLSEQKRIVDMIKRILPFCERL